jgi:hypothetical protein
VRRKLMSHKLKRYMPTIDIEECGLEYPTMRVSASGNFYSRCRVDEYIEELHKKIEALEERADVGCDSEEYF